MVNSTIAYCPVYIFNLPKEQIAKSIRNYQRQNYYDYLKEYSDELGDERVIEIIQEQLDDIVQIRRNVGHDGEGLWYNSIVWRDEVQINEGRK